MSFSVHARVFVPSAAAALLPSDLRESPAAAAATLKDCVCVAFYESGRCPYGSQCEHAHHFSELTQCTQTKLLGSVPVESIPAHFFGAAQAKEDTLSALEAAVPRSFTASARWSPLEGMEEERTVSARRRPPGKDRHLVVSRTGPQTPTPDSASLSSRTSSSADMQPQMRGAPACRGVTASASPIGGGAAGAVFCGSAATVTDTASFKMHLPLRCRYPHRSIPGTYYDVLALPRDAPHADIMAKYRAWQKDGFKRMRLVDPVGAEAVDRMIVEARNVLGNPGLRCAYDQQLPVETTKQEPWMTSNVATAVGNGSGAAAAAGSTITTPSKHRTQGQSSTASSIASEAHRKLDGSHHGNHSSSSSSIYQTDRSTPVVAISSLRNGESIW